jgi:hypothetical protein
METDNQRTTARASVRRPAYASEGAAGLREGIRARDRQAGEELDNEGTGADRPERGRVVGSMEGVVLDGWRALAAGVAKQAIVDARGKDVFRALDACLWIAEGDFDWMADRAPGDGLKLLTSGRISRIPEGWLVCRIR